MQRRYQNYKNYHSLIFLTDFRRSFYTHEKKKNYGTNNQKMVNKNDIKKIKGITQNSNTIFPR